MNTATQRIRPIVTKAETDGRFHVYISGWAGRIPHEAALSLFNQLATALGIPYSDGAAKFAGQVLRAHRGEMPGEVGDVDGGDLQDYALDAELIEAFEVTEGLRDACGDHCECTAGDRCYRLTPVGRGLVRLIDPVDAPREVQL